jgi:hypothetical protein
MNLIVLTKISKFALIASLSAFLSFASKHNPHARLFFWLILGGTALIILFAILWESRDYLMAKDPDISTVNTLISGLQQQKPGRSYYLSAQARLEMIIALIVIAVFALIGGV